MKLEFKQSLSNGSVNYITRFIPFVFEPTKGPYQKITVPEIDVRDLLSNNGSVVLIGPEGNYTVLNEESMENKPVMCNLVKFIEE